MPGTTSHLPHMPPPSSRHHHTVPPLNPALSLLVLALAASLPLLSAAAPAGGGAGSTSLVLLPPSRYGARCLDGSPPGFYHRQGNGAGANKWLIYLQGGGWCYSATGCAYRASTVLGTTRLYKPPSDPAFEPTLRKYGTEFRGMLSASAQENPAFFNWNTVMVLYCDGGGFAGSGQRIAVNRTTTLYSDGSRIVDAVLQELTARRGMAAAAKVVLSGCSAGGQAVSAVCNRVGAAVPRAAVKCLMDGGFFLDADDVTGQKYFRSVAKEIVAMHKPVVDPDCRRTYGTQVWKCFFPQNNLFFVRRPVFVVNSIADYAAIDIANQGQNASSTSRITHCMNQLFASNKAAAAAAAAASGGGVAAAAAAVDAVGGEGGGAVMAAGAAGSTHGKLASISNHWRDRKERNSDSISSNSSSSGGGCSSAELAAIQTYSRRSIMRIRAVLRAKPTFGFFLVGTIGHCTTIYPQWGQVTRKRENLRQEITTWIGP
ncbi:hypothetical protein CLOM_g16725 [Closterium sp. NIES-68]|nr:hypothetical protein CLOM_g16725 [Closterium sp. NIES-68]GJP66605.1 hypothetical protein CLOP_g23520 [Closterium sp. NIES-67]